MDAIYDIVQKSPEYFAWVFGVVNELWICFVYFNRKRHDREIVELKQNLDLDLERRKKVYEMKVNQYEAYFRRIDGFNRKHQTELPATFEPILEEYMTRYLNAEAEGNSEESNATISWFGTEVSKLLTIGQKDYLELDAETNSLKLTASDEVATLLDELSGLYEESFNHTAEYLRELSVLMLQPNDQRSSELQTQSRRLAERLTDKRDELFRRMRRDLKVI